MNGIKTDKIIHSGHYFARGNRYHWKIETTDLEVWTLETDDYCTDCCSVWGMESYYYGSSYEDCMAHLEQQMKKVQNK